MDEIKYEVHGSKVRVYGSYEYVNKNPTFDPIIVVSAKTRKKQRSGQLEKKQLYYI